MENSEVLSKAVELANFEQELQLKKLQKIVDDYSNLDDLLSSITDKRVHNCMVPISKERVNQIGCLIPKYHVINMCLLLATLRYV